MKIEKLTRNNDFHRLYRSGKSHVTPVVVIYTKKNRFRKARIGITTSKKIGNAVKRNRARRVVVAAYMQIAEKIAPGYDIVFVARGKTPYVKSGDILKAITPILTNLGKATTGKGNAK